jgi:hypothetical protein
MNRMIKAKDLKEGMQVVGTTRNYHVIAIRKLENNLRVRLSASPKGNSMDSWHTWWPTDELYVKGESDGQ